MSEQRLPEEYKGFSTRDLLEFWDGFHDRTMYDPDPPEGLIGAMHDLLREYAVMDFHNGEGGNDPAKIRRSKRLLAPFGVDPAPWADENGIARAELGEACARRQIERSKAVRARYKAMERQKKQRP